MNPDYKSLEIKFTDKVFPEFEVEFAEKGTDVVYHFFPPNNLSTFDENFGIVLEKAFKTHLPETADVRADFMSLQESQLILRHSDTKQEKDPSESFYVCVKEGAKNPMSDLVLKDRIFQTLRRELNNGN